MSGNDWQTPDWLLDLVSEIGPIKLDPCTTRDNPTDAQYIRTKDCDPNGLETNWHEFGGLVYCNPPYGRGHMERWAHKILDEAACGCEIIALTRSDTSTKWHQALTRKAEYVCSPSRISFKGAKGSPNFANSIFYFGNRNYRFRVVFADIGPLTKWIEG